MAIIVLMQQELVAELFYLPVVTSLVISGLIWKWVYEERGLLNYVLQEAVKDPQPEVHIRADIRVRYEFVSDTLAVLQRGGMRKVGFIAEPPAPGQNRGG